MDVIAALPYAAPLSPRPSTLRGILGQSPNPDNWRTVRGPHVLPSQHQTPRDYPDIRTTCDAGMSPFGSIG